MALKALMLRRSIEVKQGELTALQERESEFSTREAELTAAIGEATTDEERGVVEQSINEFEEQRAAHTASVTALQKEITNLQGELEELERSAPKPNAGHADPITTHNERNDHNMETLDLRSLPKHKRAFDALPMQRRDAIMAQEDVKEFLANLRSMRGQSRSISGAGLNVPVVFLDIISENMYRYSKLLPRVRVRNVTGEGRQTIVGTVPEAIWTEMCAAINELTFVFNQVVVDGYKVAGFVPICNSMLEDSDLNLASTIVEMLSESIGKAEDKAILYGKGAAYKMPMGIVTRLAQTSKPSDYPAAAPAWTDLHTSNILKIGGIGVTGAQFWAQLMEATGAASSKYSSGNTFWCMSEKTKTMLRSKAITFTASGDVVANVVNMLPIINGDIETLDFMPDGDIVGGYGDLYLFSQRSGMTVESSREAQFIQDNTVFKGKQRCDGVPVVPGAFVAININNQEVTTVMDFPADDANDAQLADLEISGVTLAPVFDGKTYTYTGTSSTADAKIEATAAQAGAEIAIDFNGKNVRNGGTVKQSSGAGNVYTITVKQGNAVRVYTVTVTATISG